MEFNLMDPFFHDKKPEKTMIHQLYQESPESSSDYEFSFATRFTTSPPPPNPTLYVPNIDTHMNEVHSFQRTDYSMDAMREMIYRMAMMQPVQIDPETVKPPKRKNVRISKDPQSVAARHRRERISERIRILQRMVPGGTKLDTASMLDEAVHYLKFLKKQLEDLELAAKCNRPVFSVMGSSMQMF